jgi:acetyl coenzyme A synthetase (ADP forming)-like protein
MADLSKFFNPQSVVVVGATTQQHKLGYGVSRNLISCGYPGEVYFVNRKGGVLFGQQMYTSLDQLPPGVELAVLVIPAPYVAETINACSQINIKNIIIITGGFSEIGKTGARYEADSLQIAQSEDLLVLGPNCIGVIDTHAPIDTTFLQPPTPKPGDIGFITHSGALGAGVIDWAKGEGFSFSKMVSLGNQMLLNEADILVPLANDTDTNVIALYLESVKEGVKFVHNAKQATYEKPIVAHKVGRTVAGKRAASSHTGAMAGVDKAFDAAFRRGGVIRADTTEDMFNWAKALAWSPVPKGDRVAVLTNAGGPGVTATDAVAANGLKMAELSAETKAALHDILPEAASAENPVDMLASASPEDYAACLELLLSEPEVDMVLLISPPPPMFSSTRIVDACIPVVRLHADKPVVFSMMGSDQVSEAMAKLRYENIPDYNFPEKAASALGALWRRAHIEESMGLEPLRADLPEKSKVTELLSVLSAEEHLVPAPTTEAILDAYGIPLAKLHLAETAMVSSEISRQIGFPVVLKIAADDVSHKSDIGGIQLNLATDDEVQEAFQKLTDAVHAQDPGIQVRGAYVQKMVSDGQEVIVGAVRDNIFGPMVMFGTGGVETEGLQDVVFSLAPITEDDFNTMIENTWAGKKLQGFRHFKPGDLTALKQVLINLGELMVNHPQVGEVEINPLYVFEEGKGVLAVDMRMYQEKQG